MAVGAGPEQVGTAAETYGAHLKKVHVGLGKGEGECRRHLGYVCFISN